MKRLFSLILALTLICGLIPGALAASGAISSNVDDHWYINVQRWTDPIRSTLAYEDGGYLRVECIDDKLVVERYDDEFRFLSGKELALELPRYGGVYLCDDYNFLLVGQENLEEDDAKEVFRIIRYTKDWEKVDHASIYGANTTIPFDAGTPRFDRSGDILYIRTDHEMYTTEDGLNHQANVMIAVRISDMTVTDQLTDVLNKSYGYVSHSFNQFVRVDGDTLLAVDHGDALPRSVALFKYGKKAGEETFFGRTTMVNALPIADSSYHYNDTGVSVGGFEFSTTDYLIAGCSYDQSEKTDLRYVQRNIFVTATPKDDFTDEGTAIHWLTDYSAEDGVEVSPPHLLKVSADRFFLTWTENCTLKYCFLNGSGQLDGNISTGEGQLSDCEPIRVGRYAVWYVTDRSAPVFYQIELEPCSHSYTSVTTAPTCETPGFTTHTCIHCGDSYTDAHVAPLGHEYGADYRCIRCTNLRPMPFADVEQGAFYHVPVLWAVDHGITTGTGADTFSPAGPCQRAQVVTFLWRAAGEPEPTATHNPFEDVAPTDFFYKAVLWAVEKGITNGLNATHFGPYAHCNRAQVVTFLWRSQGCPDAAGSNGFTDVAPGAWYEAPINWAVENGITNGLSATEFGVNAVCNRAQIVTFLYRTFA